MALLKTVSKLSNPDFNYLFESTKEVGEPFSSLTFRSALKRMKRQDITAHGFRSKFRDWAAETILCPGEGAKFAVAHAIGNKVEASYRSIDLL